ncbi:MAG: hypothetical protein GEU98_00410 [Pseudonocardiaceae bacterium]|nr:hypothetical protein [Pseudonocardiaceae bacterium]
MPADPEPTDVEAGDELAPTPALNRRERRMARKKGTPPRQDWRSAGKHGAGAPDAVGKAPQHTYRRRG